ncbi:hypothetical protein FZEAL_5968 [Fusarium zealandicum]|uniref:Meiosis-specific APC/C activator protein AMA1 n=1 Tax=Fusarium zealandicum TaxID=1053134 RepID=A0A8H4UIN2_9HYPO|nr:hypothetical protein FZEAL_5968 [Fusarium zealandicum]
MLQRPPRRPRAPRRSFDAKFYPPSPSDSAYGSGEDSPQSSPGLRPRCFPAFDGSSSWDVVVDSILEEQEPKKLVPEQHKSYFEPQTTPEHPHPGENLGTISPFIYTESSKHSPLRDRRFDPNRQRLDRYVPRRDHGSPPCERYRTTKEVQDLSMEERLKRNKSASVDPFVLRRRALSPDQRFPFQVDDSVLNRGTALSQLPQNRGGGRQVSVGAIWSVGGIVPSTMAIDDGRGHLLQRGTNARIFAMPFQESLVNTSVEKEKHEGRIASALDLDRVRKVLEFGPSQPIPRSLSIQDAWDKLDGRTSWVGTQWMNKEQFCVSLRPAKKRLLPAAPFRVLDAPNLKDDFYCSPLAYSTTLDTLVICLGNLIYAWSEATGVNMIHGVQSDTWLTSVAFSSAQGTKAVLGIGHSDGSVIFKSLFDNLPRFEVRQPFSISCVSWRPTCTLRPSRNPLDPGVPVQTEDLVVGDEMGNIYYYIVEWPMAWEVSQDTWPGAVSLVAKISNIHCQQICGLAWSSDGRLFASGGNDNLCCMFEVDHVLGQSRTDPVRPEHRFRARLEALTAYGGIEIRVTRPLNALEGDPATTNESAFIAAEMRPLPTSTDTVRYLGPGVERHHWDHDAAVKAIAFCPWRRGLVATGGGSNDKCIHFFHTSSGAALATIAVSAQVTSLIWSTTRREIVATFGYASPDHPYRISVFSWPECKQVAAVPWEGELRALYAIPCPRGPQHNGDTAHKRGLEGCIIVASSDKSIKFHEVWSREKGETRGGMGMLAGSDILEGLEGIDKEGEVIR